MAAAFSVDIQQNGVLIPLILLPLTIPIMIFGSGALIVTMQGLDALGYIALLLAIFPANLYMYQNDKAALGLPKWLRLLRLPLQLALIYWAFLYTS